MKLSSADLRTEVSVRPLRGQNAYGPVYGEAYEEKCVWEEGFRRIVNAQGEETVISVTAYFRGDTPKSIGDEITYQDRRYEVVEVLTIMDGNALHHLEVLLGSAGRV